MFKTKRNATKEVKVSVLQIPSELARTNTYAQTILFNSMLGKIPLPEDIEDLYKEVYTQEILTSDEPINILDKLFYDLNQDDRPNGKTMRSLSVGDVILVDERKFICAMVGWKEL